MITNLTKEELIAFESRIADFWKAGKIPGPVHLSHGNEDALLRVFADIRPEDWVYSTHRSHYHALLKGVPADWLEREILDGHSITINNPDFRFYSSAVMGDSAAIALGIAWSISLKKTSEHVWCFVGDMFAEMGSFHESVSYAERNALPITFVVEDNNLSVCTPTRETWGMKPRENKVIRYEYRNKRYPHAGVDAAYAGF